MHYGTYFLSSLVQAVRAQRPDVCLVLSTPPLLLGLTGLVTKQLRKVPFVYSVQDLYPDIAVHLGVLAADSRFARTLDLTATKLYRSASALVTLSDGMSAQLAAKGLRPQHIHVIPNWADTTQIVPAPRNNQFARAHGLEHTFVVQYSGNLGLSQGLESLVAAAEHIADLPIRIVIVGDGQARASLVRQVRVRGLQNVLFLPPQPREGLSDLLAACDVGLVTMKRQVSDDLVPSKLYGIMAAARPILAAVEPRSEVARVVRAHECGWIVDPEDSHSLALAIRRSYECPAGTRLEMGQRARQACSSLYSRKVLTARYDAIVRSVARARI
jgi:colanic acid biosynthesis glycosyl transferase WcaI